MRAITIALAVALCVSPAAAADLRYFEDAALHAVQFVDDKEGWAVGDEGVIWHTIDGGRTWERLPSGTRASLRDLHFINAFYGWVVGREELPHGGGSAGVLLFTRDGGQTWQRLLTNALPGLNRVRFPDPKIGFVCGDGNDQFPTGVFRTTDGGRSWEPVPGRRSATWLGAAFTKDGAGILAGAWSRLATLRDDTFGDGEVDQIGGRSVRGVAMLSDRALAVGQGGLVLTSKTGGARWGFADLRLTPDVMAAIDFHAVHAIGPQVWIVGRPGTFVLHSADQGVTWRFLKTGQNLPLNGVFFHDQKNGWAVGEAGTILATSDGGATWTVQRQGGKRAAVLCVHAHAGDLPLESLARLGADEGYLLAAVRLASPDPGSASPRLASPELASTPLRLATDAQRFAAAVRQAGGLAGEMLWQFSVPGHLDQADKDALMRHWNQRQRADKEILRQLVLALRTWRPEVVVTDHPEPRSGNGAGALVAEAMHEAFALAADVQAFPEQIEQLGLSPWQAKKAYVLCEKAGEAQVVHDGTESRDRLEATPRDYAAPAAALLSDQPRSLPAQRGYRLLANRGAATGQHMLDGVSVAIGDARRPQPEIKINPDYKDAVRQRRHLETLADNMDDPSRTLALIAPALAKLPDDQAAAAAFAVAHQYAKKGQWLLARETFLLLTERYKAHPLVADAYRWLIRHASSSEARRRHELGQFLLETQTGFGLRAPDPFSHRPTGGVDLNPTARTDPKGKDAKPTPIPETRKDARVTFLKNQDESRQWYAASLEFGSRLAGFGPLYATDPSIQFCLQASRRQLGQFSEVKDWYTKFKNHFPRGVWHDAAMAELWLTQSGPLPAKPVAMCRASDTKPFLDGQLDDACWQGLQPMSLTSAVGDTAKEYPTEAWFASDQEFLYVALRCRHPAGKDVPAVKSRQRDADLSAYDRVSLLIDLDRDYSTYFHLQVDQRGCVRDDCWGDLTWNPKWYVAVHSTADSWRIEAAIPLYELTGDRITQSTVWACNVVRVLPGRGVQAWSLPADREPRPEGLGLLLFRAPPSTRPAAAVGAIRP